MTTVLTINPNAAYQGYQGDHPWVLEAETLPILPVSVLDPVTTQARERVRAALLSSDGDDWDNVRVQITPTSVPRGSWVDLAMAAALLVERGRTGGLRPLLRVDGREYREVAVPFGGSPTGGVVVAGELGLDGYVRPVRGLLAGLYAARDAGVSAAIVPATQLDEARLSGLDVIGVTTLKDLTRVLDGGPGATQPTVTPESPAPWPTTLELPETVADAVMVAAAGHHHLIIQSPPDAYWWGVVGGTIARLLPPLTDDQGRELAALHSLAGIPVHHIPTTPPCVVVPPAGSLASIIGGGAITAQPGALSRAHHGVLVFNDMGEHNPRVMECLRTPLDTHRISLGRSTGVITYPADVLLVGTLRPCPCGQTPCTCTPMAIRRYMARIPGPVVDRIPLHLTVTQNTPMTFLDMDHARDRVLAARDRANHRGTFDTPYDFRRAYPWTPDVADRLNYLMAMGQLSARGTDHVYAIAWTLADLDGADKPTPTHVDRAIGFRSPTTPSAADPDNTTVAYTPTPGDELPPTPSTPPASRGGPGIIL